MTDEASFAMQYAAERKKRMELEHRVYGLLYDVIPFMIAAMDMTYDYINRDMEGFVEKMRKLGAWHGSIEVGFIYNVLFPAGDKLNCVPENMNKKDIKELGNLTEIPGLIKELEHHAKLVHQAWEAEGLISEQQCQEQGSMDMVQAIMKAHPEIKKELVKAIKESVASSVH